MEVESLAGLTAAFEEWRSKKRHPREAVPADLLERARRAAQRYGSAVVGRATKVDRGRLQGGHKARHKGTAEAASVPAFSRVEIAAPTPGAQPFAEVETVKGVKVRLFTQTNEALDLLSLLCGAGGAR